MPARALIVFILHFLILPDLAARPDTLNPVCKLLNLNSNWDFGAGAKFSFLDFDEMNRSLEDAGLPGLESPLSCLNLSTRTTFSWKCFLLETGLKYSFGSSNRNNFENRQSVTFRDYALQSRLMFDIFQRSEMSKIYPFLGLGASYQVLRTYSGSPSDEGGSSLVAEAYRNQRFTYIPFSLEAGLSLEQGFKLFGKNVFLGFRTGYAFRFFQTKWSLDGNYAVDLPKPAASSPFIALILRVKSAPKKVCDLHCKP